MPGPICSTGKLEGIFKALIVPRANDRTHLLKSNVSDGMEGGDTAIVIVNEIQLRRGS